MSAAHDPRRERLEELLVDQALVGLSPAEETELGRLSTQLGAPRDAGYALAAAALDQALAGPPPALPTALRARLDQAARAYATPARQQTLVPAQPRAASLSPRPRSSPLAWGGWLVAAAALLVAFFALRGGAPATRSAAELRSTLLARADTLRLDWSTTDPTSSAGGDVAWSQDLQSGVMRIRGLAANDPTTEQYQLWIFDETQEHPIDGGVFDVTAGEVLVPIDAKLRVQKPTLFAVTVEKPGGVVVSDQKRIVLVAKG